MHLDEDKFRRSQGFSTYVQLVGEKIKQKCITLESDEICPHQGA
jgi:hypothetical protein